MDKIPEKDNKGKTLRVEYDADSKTESKTFKDTLDNILNENWTYNIEEFGEIPHTRKRIKIKFDNKVRTSEVENDINKILDNSSINDFEVIWL